jgi:hypothetical protein
MANIALVVANRVSVVQSIQQLTVPAAEAITAGAPVRFDTSSGKFTNANGTDAAEVRVWGIATRTVAAGEPVTAIRRGLMDGFDLSGLAYDAPVYVSDTDGRLGAAGDSTVDVAVGRVVPGTSVTTGTAYDKILSVEL